MSPVGVPVWQWISCYTTLTIAPTGSSYEIHHSSKKKIIPLPAELKYRALVTASECAQSAGCSVRGHIHIKP